ncbi:hypothetical protein E3J48_08245 [Candidatus Aerophobetes bacterium]|uniref:Uncharacterized protein n=1 Tax=Aerophobetes bacterium TaxID=2030807 RepID=A0A523VWF0_UNCAE|nr:MAG: hypothetical protein E3J48_08245 [Candidatus Aerophobetes bacterium]
MKGKKLLAAFLLGAVLCFVPALGYGEIPEWTRENKVSYIDYDLLRAMVKYAMRNPNHLIVDLYDVPYGLPRSKITEFPIPKDIDYRNKIFVLVEDRKHRAIFSDKSGIALLDQFKRELEVIYSYIEGVATNMNSDVVAVFYSREGIPLGYFYQGEYHLWENNER